MELQKIEAILEAVLFTMGDAVDLSKLSAAVTLGEDETRLILQGMIERYEKEDRGICITRFEDSYQMCTKAQMYEYLIKVAKVPKNHTLTDTLLETLSIIAYKQPITRLELEKIRGVSCDHAVNKLLEYELICELGRLDAPGRPLLFGTTENFLRCFGVKSIEELPAVNQDRIEEFKVQAEEELSLEI